MNGGPGLAIALLSMVLWGFWALAADRAVDLIGPRPALLISYGTAFLVAIAVVGVPGQVFDNGTGVTFAVVAGLLTACASLAYYVALESVATGVATALVGVYFIVTAVVSVVLFGETLAATDVAGLVLAAAAVVLFSL